MGITTVISKLFHFIPPTAACLLTIFSLKGSAIICREDLLVRNQTKLIIFISIASSRNHDVVHASPHRSISVCKLNLPGVTEENGWRDSVMSIRDVCSEHGSRSSGHSEPDSIGFPPCLAHFATHICSAAHFVKSSYL